ncbi:nucleotide sugar dehydrogenase [Rhizosphaericola mali]|nr:nucleotide sugar dehydrogenase [Rhizosphaericola mali]
MDKICVVGLGYVGYPLLIALSRYYKVIGIDINEDRVKILNKRLENLDNVEYKIELQTYINTNDSSIYIVTVPTPVDNFYKPNLMHLISASKMIGNFLKKGDLIIYESTVYPGCTEEVCVKELENISGLKLNSDFEIGYSPERINPGDSNHTLENTIKIVSGSNPNALNRVKKIYDKIVDAGVYEAASIKIAEAAKVIENAQRDVNISFVNELALIFDRMGIDTNDVIDAASTKWNFMPFRPGLVGGHCISVDPYYLTYKAQELGYSPDVILSGRRINNEMPQFVVSKVVKLLAQRDIIIQKSKILILGFSFKENCDDFRNTRVADMYEEFLEFGVNVMIVDPLVDSEDVKKNYGIEIKNDLKMTEKYDAIILAVAHDNFRKIDLDELKREKNSIIFDTKNFYKRENVTARL